MPRFKSTCSQAYHIHELYNILTSHFIIHTNIFNQKLTLKKKQDTNIDKTLYITHVGTLMFQEHCETVCAR